jgi:multidrug efflux pump
MISGFFIDRPIFATVLSVVITLAGLLGLRTLPIAQYPQITPPAVSISCSYPGASSQVVADTVAAPIEQQVNGVEGMLYMSSQSGNDGSYTLTVTFEVGTDLNRALVVVQNRVNLAMPQLPTEVQRQSLTVRKRTPDILMVVNLFAPDGRYDTLYLSNYATIHLRDELSRLEGVSDINVVGQRDYSIRAWLDPKKLAALGVTAVDVADAIRDQNVEAAAGQVGPAGAAGRATQLPLDALGRLSDPEQFGDIVVKVAPSGPPAQSIQAMPPPGLTVPALQNLTALQSGRGGPASLVGQTGQPGVLGQTGQTGQADQTGQSGQATQTSPTPVGQRGPVMPTIPGTSSGQSGQPTPQTQNGPTGQPTPGQVPGQVLLFGRNAQGTQAAGGSALMGTSQGQSVGVVRLRDVARVVLGAQNYNASCTCDRRPSVGLAIHLLPGTNALDVGDAVRAKMEELSARFPDGVVYEIAYDTTPCIMESVTDVVHTLFEAVAWWRRC